MIYHLSIEADDPRHVAQVFAELFGGIATPFPPVIAGSWVAMTGDEHNTSVEIYPRGTELAPGDGDSDAFGTILGRRTGSATHMAIGTKLSRDEVFAAASREGWPAKYRKRGGVFGVIELWVEGHQMVEVLTPEMQREYLEGVTIPRWQSALEARRSSGTAHPGAA